MQQPSFQLLIYSLTPFTANPSPAGATGGHWLVTGHWQVAAIQPIFKFERYSKFQDQRLLFGRETRWKHSFLMKFNFSAPKKRFLHYRPDKWRTTCWPPVNVVGPVWVSIIFMVSYSHSGLKNNEEREERREKDIKMVCPVENVLVPHCLTLIAP